GVVVETPPYLSLLSNNRVITYSRCIHDDNDDRMAILGLEFNIANIGSQIIEIALDQNGYGMLISQDLEFIAHSNSSFVGLSVSDPRVPLSVFLDDLNAGNDIVERPFINWKGEKTVAFVRKNSNGWYLGFLTPEGPFYQSITYIASILIIFGSIFAAALVMILIRIDKARTKSDMESKHKSAFLANMSHEIRTPMNAIIGMTSIGISSDEIARKDQCFIKIKDASNHLLGVINDILDMSKIEANKFDLSPSEFNFEKMFQRAVNVVNFRIDEKRQKFNVHIDQRIPKTVIGDDQRIAQVITNLLGNAIKFTPEGGSVSLDAVFLEEIDNVCTIRISISDNGIGMTVEQQNRAFQSFEQAESSTTRKYGGTGLGLAISKSIVELMGGRIWVESEIKKGSTFSFILYMRRGSQIYQGRLSPDVNISNVRIMVVDDDRDILDYFTEIFREFKIQCDTAASGDEAIALVEKKGRYHIYFVDWRMPGMDGVKLASELKARNENVKSVVIMITAAEWTEVETEARRAGVDKFLSKPLFPSNIADVINEALGVNYKQIEESEVKINGLFAGRRILLVEDVEINREIVKSLLEPTEIEIDCAENGREAVRKFSEQPYRYDIIFMDVQMPEMDGYEATRRIRALNVPQARTIRIVAMTANVFREDIERCLESGMDNHIGKPLNFDEIIEKLRIYLPKKK
ncbi:MAG: response regulator, partial [Treponema sp.]|nr:response regulator [Treponema sp.]